MSRVGEGFSNPLEEAAGRSDLTAAHSSGHDEHESGEPKGWDQGAETSGSVGSHESDGYSFGR
jgi:hypothetical protein